MASTTTTRVMTPSRAQGSAKSRGIASRRHLPPLAFLVVLLVAWEYVPRALGIPSFIFPPLGEVLQALTDPGATRSFLYHTQVTLIEAFSGLAIGTVLGLVLGVVLVEVDILNRMIYPYIVAIQSIPKVAIAPLFVIWFGFGLTSKVVVVALLAFFPVLLGTMSGIRSVSAEHIALFKVHRATRGQIRRKLLLPSALPSIFTGFEMAVVFSTLGAIVGEFVGAQAGLGVLILQAQYRMNTGAVFACLLILCAVGITLNVIVRFVRRRILYWVPGEKSLKV
ncbi:ABC transporter permease [Micromonospora sp. NPDC048830]|uniref:ABC transporter permease n=1 Tax=Micromonospora sp. NPDC048830 TaxID=3364257 RepID=UPI00371B6426